MRKMKDSGVEWIGEIPLEWVVMPMRTIIYQNDGGIWGDDPSGNENDEYVLRSTEQTVDGKWCIIEPAKRDLSSIVNKEYYRCRKGDLLITKSSGSDLHIGKTTIVDAEVESINCYYSNFIQRVRPKDKYNARLLWYLYNSSIVREQFVYMQNSTSGIGNLNSTYINAVKVAMPDRKEQDLIVDFLDFKCSKIDEIVKKRESIIKKLKDYKVSIITEAVTKGLDMAADMKTGLVEWIECCPNHWETYRVANLYEQTSESGLEELPILTVSINTGVSDRELADDEKDRVFIRSEDRTKYKRVRPGDLVYNMMRAWQGAFGAVRVDGMVSPAYVTCRPKSGVKIDTRYIEYLLRTPIAIEEMHRYSHGIADFRLRLYWPEFKNIRLCLPPLEEQKEIADYIDEKTQRIDITIKKQEETIARLQEYKKSLIYEVVTGKKEV